MDPRQNRSSSLRSGGHDGGSTSGGGDGECGLVIHEVVRVGGGSGQYPLLTKTNYYSWVALIKLKLHVRSMWTVVNVGTTNSPMIRMPWKPLRWAFPRSSKEHRQQAHRQGDEGLTEEDPSRHGLCSPSKGEYTASGV
jgi:hypothetical protein